MASPKAGATVPDARPSSCAGGLMSSGRATAEIGHGGAEHLARLLVAVHELPGGDVEHDDGFGRRLDERAIPRAAHEQRFVARTRSVTSRLSDTGSATAAQPSLAQALTNSSLAVSAPAPLPAPSSNGNGTGSVAEHPAEVAAAS